MPPHPYPENYLTGKKSKHTRTHSTTTSNFSPSPAFFPWSDWTKPKSSPRFPLPLTFYNPKWLLALCSVVARTLPKMAMLTTGVGVLLVLWQVHLTLATWATRSSRTYMASCRSLIVIERWWGKEWLLRWTKLTFMSLHHTTLPPQLIILGFLVEAPPTWTCHP